MFIKMLLEYERFFVNININIYIVITIIFDLLIQYKAITIEMMQ